MCCRPGGMRNAAVKPSRIIVLSVDVGNVGRWQLPTADHGTGFIGRFDQRIEKGLVAKLEEIVGSEFVHMDHGEAIQVLERANEKFEFPVQQA